MKEGVLLALMMKKVEEKMADAPDSSPLRGPRGFRGPEGSPGRDFNFEEHETTIKQWAKDFALKFEHLTEEQISKLRGPQGRDGQDGRDGKDFSTEEHQQLFQDLAEEFALKFEDLTEQQISKLRGPEGRSGRDGKDFDFDKHREGIFDLVALAVDNVKDKLKLHFSDLTDEDREAIRGTKGRDGRPGKDFVFEDHLEFFKNLKPKFSDFTPEEVSQLKLRFDNLTDIEKESLKLRFADLTEEDRRILRGARGPRGQRGSQGEQGLRGTQGIQGIRGLPGPRGLSGARGVEGIEGRVGQDGSPGKDAPYITDIKVDQFRDNTFEIVFIFSDGSELTTPKIKLPPPNVYIAGGGGISTSSGSGGSSDLKQETMKVENFTLTPTNISNGYVDLASTPLVNSVIVLVKGLGNALEGSSYDYTVIGTRVTFHNELVTGGGALATGDVVQIRYATEGSTKRVWQTETFVLDSGDISNGYLDLAAVALEESTTLSGKGYGNFIEGSTFDYTVNLTGGSGGKTRVSLLNDLISGGGALVVGDVVQIHYIKVQEGSWNLETFVLTADNISNGFIDLSYESLPESLFFYGKGYPKFMEGADYDYVVSLDDANGFRRITFQNDLLALILGDVLQARYQLS